MRYDAWTLAIVGTKDSCDEPWAEIHPTFNDALASVVKTFRFYLGTFENWELADEERVASALDGIANFTIEPAVIDTDKLAEAEK